MGNSLETGCLPFGGLKVFIAKKFDMKFRNASNGYKTQSDEIGTMESIAFSGESDFEVLVCMMLNVCQIEYDICYHI